MPSTFPSSLVFTILALPAAVRTLKKDGTGSSSPGTPETISWFAPSLPGTDQIKKPVLIVVEGIWRFSLMVTASLIGLLEVRVRALPFTETETPLLCDT